MPRKSRRRPAGITRKNVLHHPGAMDRRAAVARAVWAEYHDDTTSPRVAKADDGTGVLGTDRNYGAESDGRTVWFPEPALALDMMTGRAGKEICDAAFASEHYAVSRLMPFSKAMERDGVMMGVIGPFGELLSLAWIHPTDGKLAAFYAKHRDLPVGLGDRMPECVISDAYMDDAEFELTVRDILVAKRRQDACVATFCVDTTGALVGYGALSFGITEMAS